MNKIHKIISILTLTISIAFLLRNVFSNIPLVANDFPYLSNSELSERYGLPTAWWHRGSQGLGQNSIPFLWFWPMDYLYGYASNHGFNFELIERLFGILPIYLFGISGILLLLQRYKINIYAACFASFIYVANSYILLLIDGGQLTTAIAYSFLPYVVYFIVKSLTNGDLLDKVLLGVTVSIVGFFDFRYIYISLIIFVFYIVFNLFFDKSKSVFRTFLYSLIALFSFIFIPLSLFSYMLVPLVMTGFSGIPVSHQAIDQLGLLNFTSLSHAILLMQPHWYRNVFGEVSNISAVFIVFPVLAFSSAILVRRNKNVLFWLIISIIGIFLAKGANAPFGEIYSFIFTELPGFSMFRDSSKFFVFIALAYSILSGFTLNAIYYYVSSLKGKITLNFFLFSLTLLILYPVWLGNMTGILSNPRNINNFTQTRDTISSQTDKGKVLWIPTRTPLSYSDDMNLSVNATDLLAYRAFQSGVVGTYETLNFLREHKLIGELFRIGNIKYISYPPIDVVKQLPNQDQLDYYNNFLNQISNKPWVSKDKLADGTLLKVNETSGEFFLADNLYYIVGSDRIYNEISKFNNIDLSKSAVVWAEESVENISTAFNFDISKIILYDKTELDLLLSLTSRNNLIFLSTSLDKSPNKNNWWKRDTTEFIWFRNFLQEKYNVDIQDFDYQGGWAISEGSNSLTVKSDIIKNKSQVYVRALKSDKSGKIMFYQGTHKIGEVDMLDTLPETISITLSGNSGTSDQVFDYSSGNFQWYYVGTTYDDSPLDIKTEGNINVINLVALVNDEQINKIKSQIKVLEENNKIIKWNNLTGLQKENLFSVKDDEMEAEVKYTKVNQAKYIINIENLSKPKVLVFSASHDRYWNLEYQMSLPLYGFVNGFIVSNNGEYLLEYYPQKYVEQGFIITKISFIILVVFVLILLLRRLLKV